MEMSQPNKQPDMKKPYKILMIVGIVIASLLILVVGAGLYLESRADIIIKREFSRLTDGRYRLEVGKINVSLFRRSITLNDLEIRPDSAHLPSADTSVFPKMLFRMSAKQLFVGGISFKKQDGKMDVEISKLQLNSPDIKVREFTHHLASSPKDTSRVAGSVKITINQLILSDGSVEHTKVEKHDTIRNILSGVELEIDKFFIDSNTLISERRLLGDNTHLTIKKITHMPKDETKRLELDSLHIETGRQLLKFSRFALVPTYGKDEFALRSWRHEDWTPLALYDVTCSGLDYYHLLNKGVVKIDSISIAKGEIRSLKNRNIQRNEWIKTLFQQKIQRLPVKIAVDKVMIGNFYAQYEELTLGKSEAGKITFSNLSGEISNLTNITPTQNPYIKIEAGGMVNNSGHLNATIFLPVDSLTNHFEVTATLGTTNIPDINTMIAPLANVMIQSGTVDKLTVHIVGNTTRTIADMTFLYHDLEVTLLKEKNNMVTEKKLLSEVVNQLVIKDSNPKKDKVRSTHTETVRDPYRSPFNYMWRTILDGVKETVGL